MLSIKPQLGDYVNIAEVKRRTVEKMIETLKDAGWPYDPDCVDLSGNDTFLFCGTISIGTTAVKSVGLRRELTVEQVLAK